MSLENDIPQGYQRPAGEDLTEWRRKSFAHPSWETMYGILDIRTSHSERQHGLFEKHEALLKEYYEAWFRVVTGKGYRVLARFNEQNFTDENLSQISKLSSHLNIIRSALVKPEPYVHPAKRG